MGRCASLKVNDPMAWGRRFEPEASEDFADQTCLGRFAGQCGNVAVGQHFSRGD